jgi:hypothetical protein
MVDRISRYMQYEAIIDVLTIAAYSSISAENIGNTPVYNKYTH